MVPRREPASISPRRFWSRENGRKDLDGSSHWLVVHLSDREISAEIIEACRVGDRDAFRALYGLYKDRVYSIALYFFHGDRGIAADISQQVFLRLMSSISRFRGDAEFSTWLYRMVVNVCVDAARRRKSEPPVAANTNLEALAGPDSQERDFARAQTVNSVQKAVSALPAKFRIAILLRYFEGLSYEDMARALGCSMGTVASRLSRGHRILAERLKDLGGGRL
jgi:RNA polymerase sigma-70 factor (ECF subfamily)